MSRLYNQIAGGSLNRMSGLSDGVFGFAMTVLVLDLREPITRALDPLHLGMSGFPNVRSVCPHAASCRVSRASPDDSTLGGGHSAFARMFRAAFTSAWSR